jgi:hypothetical protein
MASPRGRLAAVGAALAVLLAMAVGYVAHASTRGTQAAGHVSGGPGPVTGVGDVGAVTSTGPFYAFKSSRLDGDFGRVAVAPASDPTRRVFTRDLRCNRLAMAAGRGLCLQPAPGVTVAVEALVLDANLAVTHRLTLPGYPSRTKVAPDGRLAAVTTFVSGDSYASLGFSTRTSIIDASTGAVLFDLEKLSVTKDGQPFHASNFNFWGVTFTPDSRHLYATLGSGALTYLIRADIAARTATVVTSGVECPSLSPDGKLVAFKKMVSDDPVTWRLWILDLATGREHATTETRPIDDQASWLDDRTVMYGLTTDDSLSDGGGKGANPSAVDAGASVDTGMWAVAADGTGTPRLVLDHAWSAQLATTS